MTTSTYFIEIFRGKKLTTQTNTHNFLPGNDPKEHIEKYETKWKRIWYCDEMIWSHLFSSTLKNMLYKWYKIEESHGDTFT